MSNEFLDLSARALNESVCLFGGATFTYKGQSFQGVVNDVDLGEVLQEGGLLQVLRTIVIVAKCVFPYVPKVGDTLIANGRLMRVESFKDDEICFELMCKTAAN